MKSKWYFGIFITALALFVASQQQIDVPNQEIILQFSSDQVSSAQTKKAVLNIKNKLKAIGVSQTKVFEQNGVLKITYYSKANVALVKSILLSEKQLQLTNQDPDFPLDNDYQFDVLEIKKASNPKTGFDGHHTTEVKQEFTRASNVTPSFSATTEMSNPLQQLVNVAKKVSTQVSFGIDNSAFNIPDTRAGPTA